MSHETEPRNQTKTERPLKKDSLQDRNTENAIQTLTELAEDSPEEVLVQAIFRLGYQRTILIRSLNNDRALPDLANVGKGTVYEKHRDVVEKQVKQIKKENPELFQSVLENYLSLLINIISPGVFAGLFQVAYFLSDTTVKMLSRVFRKSTASDLYRSSQLATSQILNSDTEKEVQNKVDYFFEVMSN